MATLLSAGSGEGARRCDAKCYEATLDECRCICGGANHGKGYEGGLAENERRFGAEQSRVELIVGRRDRQMDLFD